MQHSTHGTAQRGPACESRLPYPTANRHPGKGALCADNVGRILQVPATSPSSSSSSSSRTTNMTVTITTWLCLALYGGRQARQVSTPRSFQAKIWQRVQTAGEELVVKANVKGEGSGAEGGGNVIESVQSHDQRRKVAEDPIRAYHQQRAQQHDLNPSGSQIPGGKKQGK